MPLPVAEQEALEKLPCPEHESVVARANQFLMLTGMAAGDLADLVAREFGRTARSTMLFFLRGDYGKMNGANDTRWMDARIWATLERHWPRPTVRQYGRMLPTATFRKLHQLLGRAIREGLIALVYGPPGSEKSFVLENLIGQRRAAGKHDALYIYCDEQLAPLALLRRIAREAGVFTRAASSNLRDVVTGAILEKFASAVDGPPAIVLDEAQHAPLETLEILRGLHDQSRRGKPDERPGCGLLLAGSHDLYAKFTRPSNQQKLAQWIDRYDHRDQLPGMTREEALQIAARELGNGKPVRLTGDQAARILARCTKLDAYATDPAGKPEPREYFSARALVKYCEQIRARRERP